MSEPVPGQLTVGEVVELDIGDVAHGGHCVARYEGRVVFVRYALPGERAAVRITEARDGSFCRGEAVEILRADDRRVPAPCHHFGPGGCGGCDFQHASAELQRDLKAAVVAEQLRRLAGLDRSVVVEALPGNGFGWRTRVRWALDDAGRIGPRATRSHRVIAVSPDRPCEIAAAGMTESATVLEVPDGLRARVAKHELRGRPADRRRNGRDRRSGRRDAGLPEVALIRPVAGPVISLWDGEPAAELVEHAVGQDFSVFGAGFWQVHPAAADTLAAAVDEAVSGYLRPGGTAWDLYGGVGLLAVGLARAVGPDGSVVMVESDAPATTLAGRNLDSFPQVSVATGRVEQVVPALPGPVDAIVLDPPRAGAGPALCRELAGRGAAVIVYVACDPAALARDTAALQAAGYRLAALRAFDLFPQTHHVECVASFVPAA